MGLIPAMHSNGPLPPNLFKAIAASEPHYTSAASQNFKISLLHRKSASILKLGQENIHTSHKLSNLQIRDWQSYGVALHVGRSRPLYWSQIHPVLWESICERSKNFLASGSQFEQSFWWVWCFQKAGHEQKQQEDHRFVQGQWLYISTEDIQCNHTVWLDLLIWKDD